MQRDPLGYVDGMSVFSYYAGMHGRFDPLGLNEELEAMLDDALSEGTADSRNLTDANRELRDDVSAGLAGLEAGVNELGNQVVSHATDPTNALAAVPGGGAAKAAAQTAKKTGLLGRAWRGVNPHYSRSAG